MRIIIVYDVKVHRVSKVCKYLRRWLTWVQNSVFEGEVTPATLRQIKSDLSDIINEQHDSVFFYTFADGASYNREVLGIEKLNTGNIL